MNTILKIYLRKGDWAGLHVASVTCIPYTAILISKNAIHDKIYLDNLHIIYEFRIVGQNHRLVYSV